MHSFYSTGSSILPEGPCNKWAYGLCCGRACRFCCRARRNAMDPGPGVPQSRLHARTHNLKGWSCLSISILVSQWQ